MRSLTRILGCTILLTGMFFHAEGQMVEYNFKRELGEFAEQWHRIILPDELFGKTSRDLTDIRIFGITEDNDTVEAPYLLRISNDKVSDKRVTFNAVNSSHNHLGYYFTFEIPSREPINQINLDFTQDNFDWLVSLEGSQDQVVWYSLIENYRIVAIKNNLTNYQFTKLGFPSSKFRFFRLRVDSKEKPELMTASIIQHEMVEGSTRNYTIDKIQTIENEQTRQTEINLEMRLPVRASQIKLNVADGIDYYRPLTLKYLRDSVKTEQGWKLNYSVLATGTLNSMEMNEFEFPATTFQKLKILIDNGDNRPLFIDTVQLRGYLHELVVRFADRATYYLTYGNKKATRPNYDIERFPDQVPETITISPVGDEFAIEKEKPVIEPLFKNRAWLWVVMAAIILLLGWSTMKMMRT